MFIFPFCFCFLTELLNNITFVCFCQQLFKYYFYLFFVMSQSSFKNHFLFLLPCFVRLEYNITSAFICQQLFSFFSTLFSNFFSRLFFNFFYAFFDAFWTHFYIAFSSFRTAVSALYRCCSMPF